MLFVTGHSQLGRWAVLVVRCVEALSVVVVVVVGAGFPLGSKLWSNHPGLCCLPFLVLARVWAGPRRNR